MTFKHTKFEDSVVMRSLEKIAQDKKMFISDPLIKSASHKKADLIPSKNFTENIVKLCQGLRLNGLNSYASEIEDKFFAFKQAQTLYETSPETGEDLIDAAHPKGSHHLEDVPADEAVFETILDQHLKNLKMIEKKPTGKLSTAKDLIFAVKKVFGQNNNLNESNVYLSKVKSDLNQAQAIAKKNQSSSMIIDRQFGMAIEYASTLNYENLNNLKDKINKIKTLLNPGSFLNKMMNGPGILSDKPAALSSAVSLEDWQDIKSLLDDAELNRNNAQLSYDAYRSINKNTVQTQSDTSSIKTTGPTSTTNISKMEKDNYVEASVGMGLSELRTLLAQVSYQTTSAKFTPAIKKQWTDWVNKQIGHFNDMRAQYDSLSNEEYPFWVKKLQLLRQENKDGQAAFQKVI